MLFQIYLKRELKDSINVFWGYQKKKNFTGLQSRWLYNEKWLTHAKKGKFRLHVRKAFCQWCFWIFKIVPVENKCWSWMSNFLKEGWALHLVSLLFEKALPPGQGRRIKRGQWPGGDGKRKRHTIPSHSRVPGRVAVCVTEKISFTKTDFHWKVWLQ